MTDKKWAWRVGQTEQCLKQVRDRLTYILTSSDCINNPEHQRYLIDYELGRINNCLDDKTWEGQ